LDCSHSPKGLREALFCNGDYLLGRAASFLHFRAACFGFVCRNPQRKKPLVPPFKSVLKKLNLPISWCRILHPFFLLRDSFYTAFRGNHFRNSSRFRRFRKGFFLFVPGPPRCGLPAPFPVFWKCLHGRREDRRGGTKAPPNCWVWSRRDRTIPPVHGIPFGFFRLCLPVENH